MKKLWGYLLVLVLVLAASVLANDPPTQPTLTYPLGSEMLGERTNATWLPSTDPDGDSVYYVLESSANNGLDWSAVDEAGRTIRFSDNTTSKEFTFSATPGLFGFSLPKDGLLDVARVNVSGVGTNPVNRQWKATTANASVGMFPVLRVWVNTSSKINQSSSTLTKFVLGLNTLFAPPVDAYTVRVCTATNMTDGLCPQLLQESTVACGAKGVNCIGDPDFNYAIPFALNLTIAAHGEILLFDVQQPGNGWLRTLKRDTASTDGLMLGLLNPGVPVEWYYPDVPVRLEFTTYAYPSQVTLDIGNDGSIEHTISTVNQAQTTIDLDSGALQNMLRSCRADYRGLCNVPVSVNASEGIVVVASLQAYFNVSSYLWITNFFSLGNDYKFRIKSSDGVNESSYSTSNAFSIAYDPVECGQIPTSWCNITRNTKFFPGEYRLNAVAILNNNTELDCDDASLISTNPYYPIPNIGLSFARTTNVTIKNCVFDGYNTAVTSAMISGEAQPYPQAAQAIYNAAIINNEFKNIEYAAIYLEYLNRTSRGSNPLTAINTPITIANNVINMSSSSSTAHFGIFVSRFANVTIEKNEVFNDYSNRPFSTTSGYISLNNAPRARILFNKVRNGLRGLSIYGVTRINETSGNVIVLSNEFQNTEDGISIDGFNNIVLNNTFRRNNRGVRTSGIALNNFIYANRMIDNVIQAIDRRNNTFHFLTTGNLWNNYMNDSQGCFDQRLPLGRCDDPYIINTTSWDNFPIREGATFEVQLPPDLPEGGPEQIPVELPPIITAVEHPQQVLAGNIAMVNVSATGINKLEGMNIVVDEARGTAAYTQPQMYGVSDPVLSYDISNSLFSRQGNVFTWRTNESDVGLQFITITVSDAFFSKSREIQFEVMPRDSMLTLGGVPRIGSTVDLNIFEPQQAGRSYVLALSFGNAPGIPLGDGRIIPLNYDPLMSLSVQYSSYIGLSNSVSNLGSEGRNTARWTIPNIQELSGITVYASVIVVDETLSFPQNIVSISQALPITLQA